MKKICIYHGNCADGFGAAWVVRKRFGEDDVEFFPGVYQQEPPDVTGRDVIMVDFSYKRPVIEKMIEQAKTFVLIDHHKSALEDLAPLMLKGVEDNPDSVVATNPPLSHDDWVATGLRRCFRFDMNHSGAMLTWQHFFPEDEPPQLLLHIEDRDLWRFKLEGTREIQAALFSFPYDFATWDGLMREGPAGANLFTQGAAIERKHHKDIAEFIAIAKRRMTIAGYDVPALNCPYFWSSDAGHIMAQGEKFAACYWDQPDGRVFSLRSTDEGMDVSEIAKLYGGGGHRNASGFKAPFTRCQEWCVYTSDEFIRLGGEGL